MVTKIFFTVVNKRKNIKKLDSQEEVFKLCLPYLLIYAQKKFLYINIIKQYKNS